jgi:hypothetical protein
MADEKTVASPCVAYERMSSRWLLLHALLGGTTAMRMAGVKYLPKEEVETEAQWANRLNNSVLYPAFDNTVTELSSRPFSKSVAITDLPEKLKYLQEDVDGTGKSIDILAKELLRDLIIYGVCHLLIDYSINDTEATKADEEAAGTRVYLNRIAPPELIGWQTKPEGKSLLITQIRITETKTVPLGPYGDTEEEWIRVYGETTWELHKKIEGKWFPQDNGTHTFGSVPLRTAYDDQEGPLEAYPPLQGMADLNCTHWRSDSDQRNILRLSRFGMIFGKGFPKKDVQKGILIGPSKSVITDAVEADMKYLEPSGSAIEQGRKDLEDLEMKMAKLGLRPYEKSISKNTATKNKVDEERNISRLQFWIRNIEVLLEGALQDSCKWHGFEAPPTLKVDIYSDFDVSLYGDGDEEFLLKSTAAGKLSTATFLSEIKRRGKVAENVEVTDEVTAINEEAAEQVRTEIGADDTEGEFDTV